MYQGLNEWESLSFPSNNTTNSVHVFAACSKTSSGVMECNYYYDSTIILMLAIAAFILVVLLEILCANRMRQRSPSLDDIQPALLAMFPGRGRLLRNGDDVSIITNRIRAEAALSVAGAISINICRHVNSVISDFMIANQDITFYFIQFDMLIADWWAWIFPNYFYWIVFIADKMNSVIMVIQVDIAQLTMWYFMPAVSFFVRTQEVLFVGMEAILWLLHNPLAYLFYILPRGFYLTPINEEIVKELIWYSYAPITNDPIIAGLVFGQLEFHSKVINTNSPEMIPYFVVPYIFHLFSMLLPIYVRIPMHVVYNHVIFYMTHERQMQAMYTVNMGNRKKREHKQQVNNLIVDVDIGIINTDVDIPININKKKLLDKQNVKVADEEKIAAYCEDDAVEEHNFRKSQYIKDIKRAANKHALKRADNKAKEIIKVWKNTPKKQMNDALTSRLESHVSYLMIIGSSDLDWKTFVCASVLYAKTFKNDESIIQYIINMYKDFLQQLSQQREPVQQSAGDYFTKLFEALKSARQTQLYQQAVAFFGVSTLIPLITGMGLFPKLQPLLNWYNTVNVTFNGKFADFINLCGSFIETGVAYILSGDTGVFFKNEPWVQFSLDCSELFENYHSKTWMESKGYMEGEGYTISIRNKVSEMIKQGSLMSSAMARTNNAYIASLIERHVEELQHIYALIDNRLVAEKPHQPPFALSITGNPACGKTDLAHVAIAVLANELDLVNEPYNIANMNSIADHDNVTTNQEILYIADHNSLRLEASGGKTPELLTLLDNAVREVVKADLPSKGKYFYNFKLAIICANAFNHDCYNRFISPTAYMRRFQHIRMYKIADNDDFDPVRVRSSQFDYITIDIVDYISYKMVFWEWDEQNSKPKRSNRTIDIGQDLKQPIVGLNFDELMKILKYNVNSWKRLEQNLLTNRTVNLKQKCICGDLVVVCNNRCQPPQNPTAVAPTPPGRVEEQSATTDMLNLTTIFILLSYYYAIIILFFKRWIEYFKNVYLYFREYIFNLYKLWIFNKKIVKRQQQYKWMSTTTSALIEISSNLGTEYYDYYQQQAIPYISLVFGGVVTATLVRKVIDVVMLWHSEPTTQSFATASNLTVFKETNDVVLGLRPIGTPPVDLGNPTNRERKNPIIGTKTEKVNADYVQKWTNEIMKRIVKIELIFDIKGDKSPMCTFYGLQISGRDFLFNTHSIATARLMKDMHAVKVVYPNRHSVISIDFIDWMCYKNVVDLGNDYSMYTFDKATLGIDLRGLMTTELKPGPGLLITYEGAVNISTTLSRYNLIYTVYQAEHAYARPGNCGLVYVSLAEGGFHIIGIHALGITNTDIGYAYPLPLIPEKQSFSKPYELHYLGKEILTEDLSENSWVHHLDPSIPFKGDCYGTLPELMTSNSKSSIEPTILRDKLMPDMREPILGSFVNDKGEYVSPMLQKLGKMMQVPPVINPGLLNTVVDDVVDRRMNMYPKNLKPYNLDDAINGTLNMKSMNVKTAIGFPYKGKKEAAVADIGNNHKILKEYILIDIAKAKELWLKGETCGGIVGLHYKDEPISQTKLNQGRCRIFTNPPFYLLVLMRVYFGPLFASEQSRRNNKNNYCAVGTNAASKEWEEMIDSMFEAGEFDHDMFLDGDMKHYDAYNHLIRAALTVYIKVAKKLGWSPFDIRMMEGIREELCQCAVNCSGDIIFLIDRFLSGIFGTAEVNGTVIEIIWGIVIRLLKNEPLDKWVRLKHYGDDFLKKPSLSFLKSINYDTSKIQEIISAIGFEMTSADKTAKLEYKPLSQCTFLKRGFYRDPEEGILKAPLELKSIWKSICFYDTSSPMTRREHMQTNMELIETQLWMHGRAVYEREMMRLDEIKDFLQQNDPVYSLLSLNIKGYDQITLDYKNNNYCDWSL